MLTAIITAVYVVSVLIAVTYSVWVYLQISKIKAKIDHVCERGGIKLTKE